MVNISSQNSGKPLTILVVEDDEDDYLLIENTLNKCGGKPVVNWVKNGEEAINYIFRKGEYEKLQASTRPSLIFLDIKMPKMNGLEATKIIKGNSDTKMIPVIIVSTSSHEKDVTNAYKNGANSFINKPIGRKEQDSFKSLLCSYWSSMVLFP